MGKLDGKIDAVFADMDKPRHPGAALLVIDHDEIVYSKRYSLADLETQRPITAIYWRFQTRRVEWCAMRLKSLSFVSIVNS